jgi:hypothetical protein
VILHQVALKRRVKLRKIYNYKRKKLVILQLPYIFNLTGQTWIVKPLVFTDNTITFLPDKKNLKKTATLLDILNNGII